VSHSGQYAHVTESADNSLHRFLQRIARHPTLQRSTLVRAFFESTEWVRLCFFHMFYIFMIIQHVIMHHHVAHPPGPEQSQGVIDNISDTLLNAFARVRKPDERFLVMRENVDKFEESLSTSERLWNRVRSRTTGKSFSQLSANARSEAERAGTPDSPGEDLTADYHDLAVAVQGLGFLESGITDQLNHFSNTLLEFSALLRHTVRSLEIFWENHCLTMSLDAKYNRPIPRAFAFTAGLFPRPSSCAQVERSEAA
jgi:sorting nexin-4